MGKPRYAGSYDKNHKEIAEAFIKAGASVHDCAKSGSGFPDIAVGWRGHNLLCEIKTKSGRLEDSQVKFIDTWKGQVAVIRTVAAALELLRLYPKAQSPRSK